MLVSRSSPFFSFRYSRGLPEPASPERNEGSVEIEIDPKKRGVGKTVLVVDDSATIRKMLATAFLSDGFQTCVGAENGKRYRGSQTNQTRRNYFGPLDASHERLRSGI